MYFFSSQHLLVQRQLWKHQNDMWNCSKLAIKTTDRTTPMTLFWCLYLLTWNRFHTLIWSFHCWLWANKCWLGYLFRTDVLISCQCSHWFQNIPFYSRCYRLLKSIKINSYIDTKYLSLCFLQPSCSQTFIENLHGNWSWNGERIIHGNF